ncbi:MAG: hypothetical protein LBJ64_07275 [Deltaproteobacteria bacterium]|jgi:hypothetical protein|nr:hypothetical protein [Deltaproteobacteria bacterium]
MTVKSSGRLIVCPFISLQFISPPPKAFYLTWPSWEEFRCASMAEEPIKADLSPFFLKEPSGFKSAFAALVRILREGGDVPLSFRNMFELPFSRSSENVGDIVKAVRAGQTAAGFPASLGESESAGEPSSPFLVKRDFLMVALWNYRLRLDRLAQDSLKEAKELRLEMLVSLRGEESLIEDLSSGLDVDLADEFEAYDELEDESLFEATEGRETEGNEPEDDAGQPTTDERAPVRRPDERPTDVQAVLRSWLRLAKPILEPGDVIWTPEPVSAGSPETDAFLAECADLGITCSSGSPGREGDPGAKNDPGA